MWFRSPALRRLDAIEASLLSRFLLLEKKIMSEFDTLSADVASLKASADANAAKVDILIAAQTTIAKQVSDLKAQLAAALAAVPTGTTDRKSVV